jgi:hypothetical protein
VSDDDTDVSPLSTDDRARLDAQRAVCERYLADESRASYATAAGKLGLVRALLAAPVFGSEQTYELQCLGIVLGDAMAQEAGLEWVMISDEHGRDPALRVPGTSILLFPLTMISKRVERGEAVDVFELFDGVLAQLEHVRANAPS